MADDVGSRERRPALSVLDPSPIFEGRLPEEALSETRNLAEAADHLGYRSYWVQEHHNTPAFAGTAPEILIASLAASTSRIRIGAGGVMLPNYSPLKVAEQFATLEALHPMRIELGIGRATGADPRASAALLGPGGQAFPAMLRMLLDWLLDASGEARLPPDHRAAGIRANPAGRRPDVVLLVSSAETASFAGAMGLAACYADFIAPGGAPGAAAAYREAYQPSPFATRPRFAVACSAICADTEAEAQRLALPAMLWRDRMQKGRLAPFPTQSASEAWAREAEAAPLASDRLLAGTAEQVAGRLSALATECGAAEVFVLTATEDASDRLRSYEQLIASWARATASRPLTH